VIDGLFAAVEGSSLARWVKVSRWGYAGVSAAHVFGIALLVGAILPLNLARLGAFHGLTHGALSRVLTPFAAAGLLLATATGAVLLMARASEYLALAVVQVKLALVVFGALHALALTARYGWHLRGARLHDLRVHAGLSLVLWPVVLVLGRLIAFVG